MPSSIFTQRDLIKAQRVDSTFRNLEAKCHKEGGEKKNLGMISQNYLGV